MKINWGFSPLWRENLKRIAIQCEKLSAKPHSKPPFLPFLSLFPFESESDNGYYILLRSLTFFPSQIAGCYVNVSQNTPLASSLPQVQGVSRGRYKFRTKVKKII